MNVSSLHLMYVCILDYDQLEDEDLMLIAENMGIDYAARVCVCARVCVVCVPACVCVCVCVRTHARTHTPLVTMSSPNVLKDMVTRGGRGGVCACVRARVCGVRARVCMCVYSIQQ